MPGKLVHFEVPADDTARARKFWSHVFGWSFNDPGMPEMEYRMTQTAEEQGGAIYTAPEGKTGTIVYFDTDDIDASISRVRELGGSADDKQPIPNVGWFTHCKDTEGNAFSLFQSDESTGA
jgi:predicted enzyme related to lactoylglutathione lyase